MPFLAYVVQIQDEPGPNRADMQVFGLDCMSEQDVPDVLALSKALPYEGHAAYTEHREANGVTSHESWVAACAPSLARGDRPDGLRPLHQ
jgi:hypothetical protein